LIAADVSPTIIGIADCGLRIADSKRNPQSARRGATNG
jgi:hypothetical protein